MTPYVLLSWPSAIVVAALMMIGASLYARRQVSLRNQKLEKVAADFSRLDIAVDPAAFSVTDPRHVVVVTAHTVVIVDAIRGQVVQQLRHDEVHGLRIAEGGDHITFSFILNGGAVSRTIATPSIAEFGPLFQLIARQGKAIEFIPEKAA